MWVVPVARLQMHSLKWVLIRSCQSSSILQATHKGSLSPSFLAVILPPISSSCCTEAGERDVERGGEVEDRVETVWMTIMWLTRPEKQPCLKIHGYFLWPPQCHPNPHTRCAEAAMLIFPRPWMTIRSLSLCGHKRPCDYSTSCSTPEALDDCHLTQSHSENAWCLNKEGETLAPHTSYLLHTHWTALLLESQYRTSWWSERSEKRKKKQSR